MTKITEEELAFDLDSLKALQNKRKDIISRLKEAIDREESVYDNREMIINVLENEPEQTEIITNDLHTLRVEQRKRLVNIKTIENAISDEEQAILHEQEIIKAIESGEES